MSVSEEAALAAWKAHQAAEAKRREREQINAWALRRMPLRQRLKMSMSYGTLAHIEVIAMRQRAGTLRFRVEAPRGIDVGVVQSAGGDHA